MFKQIRSKKGDGSEMKKKGKTLINEISVTSKSNRGRIRIARNLLEQMGEPEFIELYWEKETKRLGIKAAPRKAEETFWISQPRPDHCGDVACRDYLFGPCGIEYGKSFRCPALYDKASAMVIADFSKHLSPENIKELELFPKDKLIGGYKITGWLKVTPDN